MRTHKCDKKRGVISLMSIQVDLAEMKIPATSITTVSWDSPVATDKEKHSEISGFVYLSKIVNTHISSFRYL